MAALSRNLKKRIQLMFGIFLLFSFILITRIGYLQFVRGAELKGAAFEQQTRDSMVSSSRGTIYDRNLKALAQSASAEMVCVVPVDIKRAKNAEEVSQKLSEILEIDYDEIYKKATKQNSYYEIIKRRVEKPQADIIREAKLAGVRLDEDTKRYYPYGSFASHVIGFTGDDNQGLGGIEMVYDSELKGLPGRVKTAKNVQGVDMPYKYEEYQDPVAGRDIVLTIDEVIQHFTEKHLETATVENRVANGSAAIVMDVKTGEILAMATKPDFDLNAPQTLPADALERADLLVGDERKNYIKNALEGIWRNKAVVDSYEPGSTFKIATASVALEEGVVGLGDHFTCTGSRQVAGWTIRCHKAGGHGVQTFVEGVRNSCNPVFIQVGLNIGPPLFQKYFDAFGFTQKTGLELPGETAGIFHKAGDFGEIQLATAAFGQGFQITPLQLISAVGAVANGGMLMKPHLVKQIIDEDGSIVKNTEPEIVRQVISKETSDTMRIILESVVSDGTGRNAYVKGYRVAGKTGTSEKAPRGQGKRISSFVGFAPADDPKIICLLMLDEPTGPEYYGGLIAAPVVGGILDDSLRYLAVAPQLTPEEMAERDIFVPSVVGEEVEGAKKVITGSNLKYKIEGGGETVIEQLPRAGAGLGAGSVVVLYTEADMEKKTISVPDVIRLSAVESNRAITNAGLNFKVFGTGSGISGGSVYAARQDPPAGTQIPIGSVVYVEFRHLDVE